MKKNKAKILTVLFVCVILIISILFFSQLRNLYKAFDEYMEIEPSMLSLYGYSVENGVYTNEIGDAQIQLPEINNYVNNVAVIFSEPLPQRINITVYYAQENHGYSERNKVSKNLGTGSSKAILQLGVDVTTCRVDITTNIGEVFSLDKIVINDSSNKSIDLFATVLSFLTLYAAAILLFVILLIKIPLEKGFAIAALMVGLLYMLVITPLSPPDEAHHYQSTYQLSNYLLLQWKNARLGYSAHFNYSAIVQHSNVASGYRRIVEEIGERTDRGELRTIPSTRDLSYFVQYLPQAIGVALARLLNLNFIWIFLLGHTFNLLFYSLCLYLAIKRTPRFKLLFGLIGIMPMALHQATSFSCDGFINGMSLVLTASLLKAIYEEDLLPNSDFCWILVSGMLLAPAKLVYTPIILLAFLIPKQRFNGTKDQLKKVCGLFILCAVVIVAFRMHSLVYLLGPRSASFSSSSESNSELSSSESNLELPDYGLNWEGQHNYTLSFILRHPRFTARIFWDTFVLSAVDWLRCAIGSNLSGLTLVIPLSIVWQFCGLIVLSSFKHENSQFIISGKHRAAFLSVAGIIIILIMLSMFLSWTSDTRQIILGVQGRYFIPALPLLCISCNNQTIVLRRSVDKFCICAAILLNIRVIYYVLRVTCGR